jgi:hypothetical protein
MDEIMYKKESKKMLNMSSRMVVTLCGKGKEMG